MNSSSTDFTLLTGAILIDGNGNSPVENGAILVKDEEIKAIGHRDSISIPEHANVTTINYPNQTILPGLIDCHVHLTGIGDGRSGDELATLPDEVLTLQGSQNANRHLQSGVTTVRDLGAKNKTTFMLRKSAEMGLVKTPRLLLSGRPITIIGGHLSYFGTSVTGATEARAAVRQLLSEGADLIKITATGGSTRTSIPGRPSFNVDEISAITDEAHKFGVHVAAHCTNSQGILNALDGEVDTIIHGYHIEPDGHLIYREEIGERMAEKKIFLNPTLHQGRERIWKLEDKRKLEPLTKGEEIEIEDFKYSWEEKLKFFEKILSAGVQLAAGTDASWMHYQLGGTSLQDEILAHVDVGLSPMEAIVSATSNSARSCWIDDQIGTLEPGKKADILVVNGNPSLDIKTLRNVVEVFQSGVAVKGTSQVMPTS